MYMDPFPVMLSNTHYISLMQIYLANIIYISSISDQFNLLSFITFMNFQRKLQQQFYELFMNNKIGLLSPKHLSRLTQEEFYGVQQIFNARYDQMYIGNICSKEVFFKTLETLDNIISARNQIKTNSKNKTIILQDQIYLQHYLTLLFTNQEKKIIKKMIDANFHNEPVPNLKEQSGTEQQQSMELLLYIMKGIFGMNKSEEGESGQVAKRQFQFFD